jgi:hypothetical protein
MQEFFAQYQLTSVEIEEERQRRQAEHQQQQEQQSASTYFNRQASLLMLYIPLAYLFLFAFSLARLIYDMVTSKANAFLLVSSLWAVLSVGLADALLYVSAAEGPGGWGNRSADTSGCHITQGLAEFLVRRRVRRQMPEKFETLPGAEVHASV